MNGVKSRRFFSEFLRRLPSSLAESNWFKNKRTATRKVFLSFIRRISTEVNRSIWFSLNHTNRVCLNEKRSKSHVKSPFKLSFTPLFGRVQITQNNHFTIAELDNCHANNHSTLFKTLLRFLVTKLLRTCSWCAPFFVGYRKICSIIQQQANNLHVTGSCRHMQRCFTINIRRIDISSCIN